MKMFPRKWWLVIIPGLILGLGWACGGGSKGQGNGNEADVPAAPSNLQATATSSSQINLSWTDNSSNEDEFKIERKTGANGIWEYLGSVTANVVSCSDTGLSCETTYYYRVSSNNDKGDSDYSNESNAETQTCPDLLPSAPSYPQASTISASEIDFSWTDNSNNEDGFKIERKTGSGGTFTQVGTVGAGLTTYQDSTLTCGTTYYYRANAFNGLGNSDYSSEVEITSAACPASVPTAPSDLTAVVVPQDKINLHWTDNSDNENGFKIERKTGSTGTYVLLFTTGADVTSYSDTGLLVDKIYYYRVYAYNSAGDSDYSNEFQTSTPGTMTSIPAGCFNMGDAFNEGQLDERPVHHVCVSAFQMDVFEVTNIRYKACADAGSCIDLVNSSSDDNSPFLNLNWSQAKAYCEWVGGRLPTEAEWEYAARGGLSGKRYPWGNNDPICTLGATNGAQYHSCSQHDAIQVGSFAANGYGLYDMAGNAWEWVNDWYDSGYYAVSPTNDPTGPSSGSDHILRGGGWDAYTVGLRVADRFNTYMAGLDFGFRCAK
jgi:formylglycine-generating enzyme required for sulfatase activity